MTKKYYVLTSDTDRCGCRRCMKTWRIFNGYTKKKIRDSYRGRSQRVECIFTEAEILERFGEERGSEIISKAFSW